MLNSVLNLSIYSTVLSLRYYTNHEIYTGVYQTVSWSVGKSLCMKLCTHILRYIYKTGYK